MYEIRRNLGGMLILVRPKFFFFEKIEQNQFIKAALEPKVSIIEKVFFSKLLAVLISYKGNLV